MAERRQSLGHRTIFLEDEHLCNNDNYDDKNHLHGPQIQALQDAIEQEHTLRRDNMCALTDRIYSTVTPIPRIGCLSCCSTQHETSECTVDPRKKPPLPLELAHQSPPTTETSDTSTTESTSLPDTQPNPSRISASQITNTLSTINGYIQSIQNDKARRNNKRFGSTESTSQPHHRHQTSKDDQTTKAHLHQRNSFKVIPISHYIYYIYIDLVKYETKSIYISEQP